MKISDRDEEVSPVIKEPRLESQELRTSSSSATAWVAGMWRAEGDKDQSLSVSLATKLRIKAATKELQVAAEELSSKRIAEGDERLREWSKVLSGAGYFCEVRYLMKELSP